MTIICGDIVLGCKIHPHNLYRNATTPRFFLNEHLQLIPSGNLTELLKMVIQIMCFLSKTRDFPVSY